MTHRNDHGVVRIEVFGIELMVIGFDHGAAFVTILLLHLLQFILHDLLAELGVAEYLIEELYRLHQFIIFTV